MKSALDRLTILDTAEERASDLEATMVLMTMSLRTFQTEKTKRKKKEQVSQNRGTATKGVVYT